MTNNDYQLKSKEGIPFIDLWSMFYLFLVYSFTLIFDQGNIFVYFIYLVCAVPFIYHLDRFVCVCFLLSTASYYFIGADEGIWSLYSILAVMMVLQSLIKAKIVLPVKSFLYLLWMIFAIVVSYNHSHFSYSMGMFAMVYNIVITILIAITIKLKRETIVSFLPRIAAFQLVVYIGMLLINGYYDGYGFTISGEINRNTFGSSVAILSIILLVKNVFFKGNNSLYKFLWFISLIVTIIAGSRNALLAMVLTAVIIFVVSQKHRGKAISGGIKLLAAVCVVIFLAGLLLPEIGIDLSRYDYVELISTGGSNRTIIWETLSPVIWKDYKWFGYGPGHFCSEQMITDLMPQGYAHTHNTIFESWGELGFLGLAPFILILLWAYKKGRSYIKNESCYLMIGFLFIEFFLLGLGESFFADIKLWIVIGLLLGNKKELDESV